MEIRVSFIVITYNRALNLEKTLDNIREFITSSDELLVIDGGSTDSTLSVLKKNSDIVSYFESGEDFGPSHALNKGILKSRGRFIMNLNDDDFYYPDGVRKAINVMDDNPEIDALLCGGEWYHENEDSEAKLIGYQYLPEGKILASDIRNCLIIITTGFFILRRNIFSRVGLFDTTVQANDTEFSSRLILNNLNFKYLNIKMFRHIGKPYSSQHINISRAKKDLINIAIKHGAWDFIYSRKFNFIDIVDALNFRNELTSYQTKNMNLLYNEFVLSPCFRKFSLKTFFLFVSFFNLIIYILKTLKRNINRFKKYAFSVNNIAKITKEPYKMEEPKWDGSLR
jgi:glycosyltransferase involved in cell wall biosynthesis